MRRDRNESFNSGVALVVIPIMLLGIIVFSIYGIFLPEFIYTTRRGAAYCFKGINKNVFCMASFSLAVSFIAIFVFRYFSKVGVNKNLLSRCGSFSVAFLLGSFIVIITSLSIASFKCVN